MQCRSVLILVAVSRFFVLPGAYFSIFYRVPSLVGGNNVPTYISTQLIQPIDIATLECRELASSRTYSLCNSINLSLSIFCSDHYTVDNTLLHVHDEHYLPSYIDDIFGWYQRQLLSISG